MAMALDFFKMNQNRDRGVQFISLKTALDDTKIHYFEKENAIGVIGEFAPVTGWSRTLGNAVVEMLNMDFPADTFTQFIQLNYPYIDTRLEQYLKERDGCDGDISVRMAQQAVRERAAFLSKGCEHALIPSSDIRTFSSLGLWTLKIPLKKAKNPIKANDAELDRFYDECDQFLKLVSVCRSHLDAAGLPVSLLDRHGSMAVLRRYFNIKGPWDSGLSDNEPLNEQLFPPGSAGDWEAVNTPFMHFSNFGEMGQEQYVGALTIDRYPDQTTKWHMSKMNELLGNPAGRNPQPGVPFAITTTIHYPEQNKERAKFVAATTTTDKSAKQESTRKYNTRISARQAGFKLMNKSLGEGGQVVNVNTTIQFFHENKEKVRDAMTRMQSYLSSMGMIMKPETFLPEVSFLNNLPMNISAESAKKTFRFRTMTSRLAAHLLPVFDDWGGYGNEMMFTTRRGKLVSYSIFHDNNSNYNTMILGEPGAGKTTTTQNIIEAELSLGAKVWTVDTGSSNVASASVRGAEILDIHEKSDLCLNPFTKVSDFNKEAEMILPILGKMAKPIEGLNDYENVLMLDAMKQMFTRNQNHTDIDDIIDYLYSQSGRDAEIQHRLARLLSPFGSDMPMGRWFNGTNNFRTEADWTLIELSGMSNNEHLRDVILMVVASTIKQEVYLSRDNRRRILVLGECGELLGNRPFAEFTARLTSKNRKEDGGVVVEAQHLGQIHATEYGALIQGNCYTKMFLKTPTDSLENARKQGWFEPSPYIDGLLKSLHTVAGQYSEICIIAGDNLTTIVRLIETPYNRVMYNTKGQMFKELQNRVRNGEDVTDLIAAEARALYGDGTYD